MMKRAGYLDEMDTGCNKVPCDDMSSVHSGCSRQLKLRGKLMHHSGAEFFERGNGP